MTTLLALLNDGFFAAIAAIGFISISNPSRNSLYACGALAAAGHVTRYVLLHADVHLTLASFTAGLIIGILSIPVSKWVKRPAEIFSFPALLPMIPGKFAYGTIQSLLECLRHSAENDFMHYFYLLNYNLLTCTLTIVMMVVGVTIPLFAFRNSGMNMLRKARKELQKTNVVKALRRTSLLLFTWDKLPALPSSPFSLRHGTPTAQIFHKSGRMPKFLRSRSSVTRDTEHTLSTNQTTRG